MIIYFRININIFSSIIIFTSKCIWKQRMGQLQFRNSCHRRRGSYARLLSKLGSYKPSVMDFGWLRVVKRTKARASSASSKVARWNDQTVMKFVDLCEAEPEFLKALSEQWIKGFWSARTEEEEEN